jgi:hypothetical protein
MEALALARQLGLQIAEIPVQWRDDPRSRVTPLIDALRISLEFLRIRRAIRSGAYALPDRAAVQPPAALARLTAPR